MKIPKWAPAELVVERNRVKALAVRREAYIRKYPDDGLNGMFEMERLEDVGELPGGGLTGLEHLETLGILSELIANKRMESVWKSLSRKKTKFKARVTAKSLEALGETSSPESVSQSFDLYHACATAKYDWKNSPRLTRIRNRELLLDIANRARELRASLLKASGFDRHELWNVVKFLDRGDLEDIADIRAGDTLLGSELDNAIEDVVDSFEFFPPVPAILTRIQNRAETLAADSKGISQPNRSDAEVNFFIRELSAYFAGSYGQPLHANVAAITCAVMNADVDYEGVKALINVGKDRRKNGMVKKLKSDRQKSYR